MTTEEIKIERELTQNKIWELIEELQNKTGMEASALHLLFCEPTRKYEGILPPKPCSVEINLK